MKDEAAVCSVTVVVTCTQLFLQAPRIGLESAVHL